MQKFPFTVVAGLALSVAAQAQTWVGGTGTNVTTAANWSGGVPANTGTATPSFPTTGNTSVNFDTAYSLAGLAFSGSASYSLNGSALTLGAGGIASTASGGQFINNAITLGADAAFSTSGGSALTTTGAIDVGAHTLTLSGGTSNVSALGNISGTGGIIVSGSAPGVTFLSGTANSYSGGTTINSGATLSFGNTSGVGVSIPGDVTDNGTLNIKASALPYTYAGAITGSGRLQVLGTNTLTLSGANTYSGQTIVAAGTLLIGADNTLPVATALSVGAATVDVAHDQMIDHFAGNMGSALITIESTKTLTINPASGGSSSTYNGTFSGSGALVITGSSAATTVLKSASPSFSGGTTVHSGTLELDNTSGSALGSGSVTVDSGAQIVAKANSFAGFTGTFSLSGTMRPSGTLAAGATTINPGARYTWLLTDTAGAAGTTYGQLIVTGALTLAATAGSPFVIAPTTFINGVGAGAAANFDTTQNYSFTLATSTLGVAGFDAATFAFDMSAFVNAYTGTWSVATSGDGKNLLLNYTGGSPIPEPSTVALGLGLCALGVAWSRQRRRLS